MDKLKSEDDDFIKKFEKTKYSSKEYLKELENFLDKLDNIEDENLRKEIIYKMHRLENIVCGIAMDIVIKYINE